ncbi:MAG: S-adenosylmethionine:tRNA ribosyltransferase-isomerase [Bacteroidetes bacterium]|nr:S-adenosylmethionine:tRNA ribosyltransferase-isomerase [Bacteroidota bacterium]
MKPDPRNLRISDYSYELPDERIARYPLPRRDEAKLLICRDGELSESIFKDFAQQIPESATLVLNNAKVVRARLQFQKPSGGLIEIFCLEPDARYPDISTALAQSGEVHWQCLVGGAARWKAGTRLRLQSDAIWVEAEMTARNPSDFSIHFRWEPAHTSWAEVLEKAGEIPLPPYLHRDAELRDTDDYQTLFAQHEGSVAAPTASLHFTQEVLDKLAAKKIRSTQLTLHVGAGTFMPVKSEMTGAHEMHGEWIEISSQTIDTLIEANKGPVVAAGTTSLRSLESLYWLGCKTISDPEISFRELKLKQWEAYDMSIRLSRLEALKALRQWMTRQNLSRLITRTELLIAPGYSFQMTDALLTNFHQPRSTLLLLVAAFIGEPWKQVYDYALAHDFRFLSYGDASLLWRKELP